MPRPHARWEIIEATDGERLMARVERLLAGRHLDSEPRELGTLTGLDEPSDIAVLRTVVEPTARPC